MLPKHVLPSRSTSCRSEMYTFKQQYGIAWAHSREATQTPSLPWRKEQSGTDDWPIRSTGKLKAVPFHLELQR